MSVSRRGFLGGGLGLGALGLTGCEEAISWFTRQAGPGFPEGGLEVPGGEHIDPYFHLLSRAAFGPWPGDLERVRELGQEAWLEEQLHPEGLDDRLCDLRARRFESLHLPAGELFEFKREVLREELTRATLLRAVYSRRQLREVMVRFWSDHLNIDSSKGDCAHLKTADDREVIRRHALGNFRDLIRASALSPAMLVYLDGTENRTEVPGDVPNENYARELLELHTLGVDGGYTQEDVMEAARCLTGWRVRRKWRKGSVVFEPHAHDDGAKRVLGVQIPAGGGEDDLERLLDIVCFHPSTARHIARKLRRSLVSLRPRPRLEAALAEVFLDTHGDLKSVLRTLFGSQDFAASRGECFKRPFRFVVTALRGLAADTHAQKPVREVLDRLGQALFQFPTPDGYPGEPEPWLGTLLWRWNFALALSRHHLGGARFPARELARALTVGGQGDPAALPLPRAFAHLVGRLPDARERLALEPAWEEDPALAVGLILSSPAFQRC